MSHLQAKCSNLHAGAVWHLPEKVYALPPNAAKQHGPTQHTYPEDGSIVSCSAPGTIKVASGELQVLHSPVVVCDCSGKHAGKYAKTGCMLAA